MTTSVSPRISPAVSQSDQAPQIEALALPGSAGAIPVVRDRSGQGWMVLRDACRELGIDANSQRQRLKRSQWAVTCLTHATGTDGKVYQQVMLRVDQVAMWLASVDAARLADPALRERLKVWQQQAAAVLDRWVRGVPEQTSAIQKQEPERPAALATIERLVEALANDRRQLQAMLAGQRAELERERAARDASDRAQSEERRLSMTMMADVAKLLVGLREQPKALPAPSAEWVNTATLCAQLGLSVSHLNKKLRLRNKQDVDAARKWTRTDGYHWNIEAMRKLLAGPIPERRWEPPAPALPKTTATQHDLRKVCVLRVNDLCVLTGMESSDGRRLTWRTCYGAFAKRASFDPMSDARDKESCLDVIERRECMPTFLAVVEDLIKEAARNKNKAPDQMAPVGFNREHHS